MSLAVAKINYKNIRVIHFFPVGIHMVSIRPMTQMNERPMMAPLSTPAEMPILEPIPGGETWRPLALTWCIGPQGLYRGWGNWTTLKRLNIVN